METFLILGSSFTFLLLLLMSAALPITIVFSVVNEIFRVALISLSLSSTFFEESEFEFKSLRISVVFKGSKFCPKISFVFS